MKNKQKYDKETLSQYTWGQLYRLQCRLADRKMKPGAIISICVSIASFFIKNPWLKPPILIIETALIIWLVVLIVRFKRIDRIMEEK